MHRTHRALASLAIGLALVGATTALAAADPASRTQEQTDQGKALYQSELESNLATTRAASAAAGPTRPPSAQAWTGSRRFWSAWSWA
jgi:hypothetical protein